MRVFSTILLSFILVVTSACATSHEGENNMAIGEVSQQQLMANYRPFQENYAQFQLSNVEVNEIKRWPNVMIVNEKCQNF